MRTSHASAVPLATEVMKRGPAQFDMVGQFLGYSLHDVDECITAGLAQRLAKYAAQELDEAGFSALSASAKMSVYTLDGDQPPADRSYCVRWQNAKGGYVEVVGNLTRKGWPTLNHGFAIGQEPQS
ncbi:hypothetical protein DIE18_04310 [Burkholderia sp. Bp9125]|nr:hypothetical protein DIE18_04310 [Burkholderia sp. Bp9125]